MNAQKKSPGECSPNDADSGVRSRADTKKYFEEILRLAPRTTIFAVYHNDESAMVHKGDLVLLANTSALMLDVFGSRVNAELNGLCLSNASKLLLNGYEAKIKQEDEYGMASIVTITIYSTQKQADLKLQSLFVERLGL